MSVDEISEQARMTAHRVLDGKDVSDGEMRFVTAGLLLSVDKLTNAIFRIEGSLWTEDRLKVLVENVVKDHCERAMFRCQQIRDEGKSATWLARFFRSLAGFK